MTDFEETVPAAKVQSFYEMSKRKVDIPVSKSTEQLSEGLLSLYQSPMETIKKELDDLTSKQEALLAHMQIENKRIQDIQEDVELNEMLSTISSYQEKLAIVKRNMFLIHERTQKLKRKVLHLQQTKEKEILNKEYRKQEKNK